MSEWPARLVAGAVRLYQLVLRPLLPPACRYEPSCSEYARQVILSYGVVAGIWLATRRICRCHPWHVGGYDPPPPGRVVRPEQPGG